MTLMTGLINGLAAGLASGLVATADAVNLVHKGRFNNIVTLTRASDITYIDSDGLLKVAGSNVFPVDYSQSKTAVPLWKPSTNLITYSNDFTEWSLNSFGNGSNPVVTANFAISPDGTQNADRIVFDGGTSGGGGQSIIQINHAAASATSTFSVWLKTASGTVDLFLRKDDSGTDSVAEIITITDEWQRFNLTSDFGAGADFATIQLRPAFGSSGGTQTIYAYGAQVENYPYPTAYIPTDGAPASRAAANVRITGGAFDSFYNQEEGTIFIECFIPYHTSGFDRLWEIRNGTNVERVTLLTTNTNNLYSEVWEDGTTTDGANVATDKFIGIWQRIVYSFKTNDFNSICSGQSLRSFGETIDLFDDMTGLWIGQSSANSSHNNVYIKELRYYPKKLTNDEITALSIPDYDYFVDGDSYAAGSGGVGLEPTLNDRLLWVEENAIGGDNLETIVSRIEANPLRGNATCVLFDGGINDTSESIASKRAKYQRAFDACNGNIIICTPALYTSRIDTPAGQLALDVEADLLITFGADKVIPTNAIARTTSGATFTDPQDASDSGYASTAYDDLFQSDNVHPQQPLMTAIANEIINKKPAISFDFTDETSFDFTDETSYTYN